MRGMTCEHCEMRVQDALSKVEGVKKVKADRTRESAEVSIGKGGEVSKEALAAAVHAKLAGPQDRIKGDLFHQQLAIHGRIQCNIVNHG